jgi:hypothetical protein
MCWSVAIKEQQSHALHHVSCHAAGGATAKDMAKDYVLKHPAWKLESLSCDNATNMHNCKN